MKKESAPSRQTARAPRAAGIFALLLLTALAAPARADDVAPSEPLHRPWSPWATVVPVGYASLHRVDGSRSDKDSVTFFAVQAGVAIHPQVLLGVEFVDWYKLDLRYSEAEGITGGSGIKELLAVAHYYPVKDARLGLQAGIGRLSGDGSLARRDRDDGLAWMVGIGYDFRVYRRLAISPMVRFTSGKIGDLTLRSWTAGIGLSWR